MLKREVVKLVVEGKRPPYVPWSFRFSPESMQKLVSYYGSQDIEGIVENHIYMSYGGRRAWVEDFGSNCVRDAFGIVYDRTHDKDIGTIVNCVLPQPSLKNYTFPDPCDRRAFAGIGEKIGKHPDRFQVFYIPSALYERAWAMRGMENLLMDFIEHPEFVHELLEKLCDYNIEQIREAIKYNIDAVLIGDDWAYQHGLQMGHAAWREFIYPVIKRLYAAVKDAGKYVFIHCCGRMDELFDELIDIGVDCFNPFQPEVMDVERLLPKYCGRITFWGGLSVQNTMPFGTPVQVEDETKKLLTLGSEGSLILSPAHTITPDVPLENMLSLIATVKNYKDTYSKTV